jgi:hypothetical protein
VSGPLPSQLDQAVESRGGRILRRAGSLCTLSWLMVYLWGAVLATSGRSGLGGLGLLWDRYPGIGWGHLLTGALPGALMLAAELRVEWRTSRMSEGLKRWSWLVGVAALGAWLAAPVWWTVVGLRAHWTAAEFQVALVGALSRTDWGFPLLALCWALGSVAVGVAVTKAVSRPWLGMPASSSVPLRWLASGIGMVLFSAVVAMATGALPGF